MQIQPKLNAVEQEVAKRYRAKSDRCEMCKKYCEENRLQLHGPLSFFHIGEKFRQDQHQVVFVGKNHWYTTTEVEELKFLYSSTFRDCRDDGTTMFLTRQSMFWRYIHDMAKRLYPEEEDEAEILDHVSITNLTKCNTSTDYRDTTPYDLTDNCIEIFEEEIKALRPKHLVLLTGKDYDSYIEKLSFGYATTPEDMTRRTHKKEIKKESYVWWWHRRFFGNGEVGMHLLRTRHPQGAHRELVDEVVKWIKRNH